MLVGTSEQIKRVGLTFEHTRFLCCTSYLVKEKQCNNSEVNDIILPSDLAAGNHSDQFFYFPITYGMVSPTVAQGGIGPYRVNLTTDSIWYMFVVNCNDDADENATTVRIRGTSVWVNPFGYLPGQLYGQLPVYWTLTILYLIFLLGWGISCLVYRHSLHAVQWAMLLVLLVSLLENLLWGSAFIRYNNVGTNENLWNGFGTFFLATKLTISRTMLLLISMGYSITKSEIPAQEQYAVLALSLCYFIIVAANHFVTILQDHGEQISYASKLLLVFLDFMVSVMMFCWIFASLHFTRSSLLRKHDLVKRRMYTILAVCIGIVIGISIVIFIGEFIIQLLSWEDKVWRAEFFFTLYWEFAFFIILVAVGIIWRPHRDNYRYAHVDELGNPTDEHELDAMDETLNKVGHNNADAQTHSAAASPRANDPFLSSDDN